MLLETRKNFNPSDAMTDKNLQFHEFLLKWLKENVKDIEPETYAVYSYNIKSFLFPYFERQQVRICDIRTSHIEAYYHYEKNNNHTTQAGILQLHEIILQALDHALELTLIESNPAKNINPATKEVSILFTDFMLEWLEMMKQCVEETTFASYSIMVKRRIVPYFKEKQYTLANMEENPKYIQEYYQHELDLGLSANTVIHRHANIRKALKYVVKIGLIKSNPADCIERPRKLNYAVSYYKADELSRLFEVSRGDPLELGILLASFYGLRRSEIVGLKWDAIDFEQKTITIKYTVTEVNFEGKLKRIEKERTKSKSSCRTLPLVKPFEDLLIRLYLQQKENRRLCGDCYCQEYLDFIYVNEMGERMKPGFLTQHFSILLKKNGLRKIRFHDLRHPYVKPTTKNIILQQKPMHYCYSMIAHKLLRKHCNILLMDI